MPPGRRSGAGRHHRRFARRACAADLALRSAGHHGSVTMKARASASRYHVYVGELDDRVWNRKRFRDANPGCDVGKPFLYVGMTGLDPDLRFDRHKAGVQANRYVQEYGVRLVPSLYCVYNPMPYQAAREMEVELAIGLREAGHGVWQA
jgi:hypothetical protein